MASASSPTCAICLEGILPVATLSTLNCNHTYHRNCLQPWLDTNHRTCPLDREAITTVNGEILTSSPEAVTRILVVGISGPLEEARALFARIRVLPDPSPSSTDSLSRTAAKVEAVALAIFSRLAAQPDAL